MMTRVPGVLNAAQIEMFRGKLERADWIDGRATAGAQSAKAKQNRQLPQDHPVARELGDIIIERLGRERLFMAAALPRRVFPPLFNRYEGGENFGVHVDNAIRELAGTRQAIRTDLSATLFLSDDFDGGELTIEDTYGVRSVRLPPGDMVLYSGASLHRVQPVTRGVRLAAFFWVQSMVRDEGKRTQLFDLDMAIQRLTQDVPDHPAVVQLTGVYHNLLRRWAEL